MIIVVVGADVGKIITVGAKVIMLVRLLQLVLKLLSLVRLLQLAVKPSSVDEVINSSR